MWRFFGLGVLAIEGLWQNAYFAWLTGSDRMRRGIDAVLSREEHGTG